ncbi:NCLX-like protein [Mya arenaria]|uniref:NCLX-like protein n=1 Tax=Mya arenaria TaxID=6604 RepID=A0ABY7DZF2_MYAAR|nr:NCLX-like protein [Mya arenaria]
MCSFVNVTDDCQIDEGFLDYTYFVYCDFDHKLLPLAIVILLLPSTIDIFSAIAAIGNAKNGDAGLAIGALFGAGVFVTTVVAGFIAIICPFDAMQRPFLRDVIFYIAAVLY